MDVTKRRAQRELKRQFELDRHCEETIAKAFAERLACPTPQEPASIDLQTASVDLSASHFQEIH